MAGVQLSKLSGTVCLVKHSRTKPRPWGQREGVPRLLLAKLLPLAFLAGLAALGRIFTCVAACASKRDDLHYDALSYSHYHTPTHTATARATATGTGTASAAMLRCNCYCCRSCDDYC